jgi:hypothetical protein
VKAGGSLNAALINFCTHHRPKIGCIQEEKKAAPRFDARGLELLFRKASKTGDGSRRRHEIDALHASQRSHKGVTCFHRQKKQREIQIGGNQIGTQNVCGSKKENTSNSWCKWICLKER